jgi:hypothetical protein
MLPLNWIFEHVSDTLPHNGYAFWADENGVTQARLGEITVGSNVTGLSGKGADTVTVTKNEILTALNKPEDFFLALVEVDGDKTKTVYLRNPSVSSRTLPSEG